MYHHYVVNIVTSRSSSWNETWAISYWPDRGLENPIYIWQILDAIKSQINLAHFRVTAEEGEANPGVNYVTSIHLLNKYMDACAEVFNAETIEDATYRVGKLNTLNWRYSDVDQEG